MLFRLAAPLSIALFPARSFAPTRVLAASFVTNRLGTCPISMSSVEEDPYIWLEDVESEKSLAFAKSSNEACLKALGDPKEGPTYDRVLAVLESKDRIPYASKLGSNDKGEELLFNFWKDSTNPKGLWRKTSLTSYQQDEPEWHTVLDLDELAKKDGISWVWKGSRHLPRARDPLSQGGKIVTRALIQLSRGGSDAVHIKEFDFLTGSFVKDDEQPFVLGEAKSRVSYKSRDLLSVGSDFGPDSLTDSGYPRTVREWVRGTDVDDAPVVFEGETTDVAVGAYVDDQRHRNGPIYEVRYRSITFYASKRLARIVEYEHLLAPDDPLRQKAGAEPEFTEIKVQDDAEIDFVGNMMIISLRSDWEPSPGQKFITGSLVYVNAKQFLEAGPENCEYKVLFRPEERSASEYYCCTKNYVLLKILDNVKSRVEMYRINENQLIRVGKDMDPKIMDISMSAVDGYSDDRFWLTTSSFLQPSTLSLADVSLVESDDAKEDITGFATKIVKALPPQFDAQGLDVIQGSATSKDGTKIPYFLIKKEGIELNWKNPTLLYGYGGFEISLGPHYVSTAGVAWLERGGVYVEANIRGGGEFGAKWHQAALKENRIKSYEDFIAVAEELIEVGYCKPKTLAIRGGSNGGLLVGNMYTIRPDLFGAIHCAVPLLDMKRFNLLLAGASWMGEYGDPSTDDWENFLHQYSPYHNLDKSVDYPPMLVTTSTRDDRVHPGHARKMVKKLWDLGKDNCFYYENIEGGHGGAADAKQSAFMLSLAYDFLFKTLSDNAVKV